MTDYNARYPRKALEIAQEVLASKDKTKIIHFLAFKEEATTAEIHFLFDVWARYFFPRYYQSESPQFHHDIIDHTINVYMGRPLPDGKSNYINLGFRGCGKTTMTKLLLTYFMLADMSLRRKYVKVLTRNQGNSKQIVTDVYNMMVELKDWYGNYFIKEDAKKREETMGSFTMTDGRKLLSGTIGMTQRGHLQDAFRPDFILFDDVEDNESIESLAQTEATINRADEALQGLSADGNFIVNGNYISEEGVIQWFINMTSTYTHKIPIMDEEGNPVWLARYDKKKIEELRGDALDFYGDYMVDPSSSDQAFFDRARVDADLDTAKQPDFESAGVKYWGKYQPHHKYAIGADTSEGIGKDANTFALWDFGTFNDDVARLTATYFNNRIPPDLFGHELVRVGREFGNCLIAPEANNTGHATIAAMRGYNNIYMEVKSDSRTIKRTERYGWRTTRKTKPQMLFEFRKDYNDGKLKIYDKNVLKEMRSYTTADLTDTKAGLVTRHFDLLMAVIIGYMMRKYASFTDSYNDDYEEEEPQFSDIGL